MRNFLSIFLALALALTAAAQQRVVVQGYVTEEKSFERVPDVMVVNARTEERISTDRNGRFRIEARLNDTLVFSRPVLRLPVPGCAPS